ncbi:MAG: hypothetical protein AB1Z98_09610, partial [Nannocystaceae bacterium]
MNLRRRLGPVLILGLVACSREPAAPDPAPSQTAKAAAAKPTPPAPLPALDVALLRRHIQALSDDAMQGRRPGTEGGAQAVAYIQSQMEAL